ncbi:MAG: von Willebrand factor type A domain-containing protein [Saprospiraceae bacterium]
MKRNYLLPLFVLFTITVFYNCSKENASSLESGLSNSADFAGDYDGNYDPTEADPASGDQYNEYEENGFVKTTDKPISTFSIDADGGAYSNTRRYLLNDKQLPPRGAIRTEEFINYFHYDYPQATGNEPIALNGEVSDCPWKPDHKLLRIGIRGKDIPRNQLPNSNFVFLIDVSGSMSSDDKLGMLRESFKRFTDQMRDDDRIAIVTYAGADKIVLESTAGSEKRKIKRAIDKLKSGGSTAGAKGIITAYEIAERNFIEGGNNRVVLGSDGDFNVGPSTQEELVELIEAKRESGVFLTVLGVGRGNYNEAAMEQIANNGNGTYEYLDSQEQADKVFIHEFNKFYTVAKDVKIQIEFNPAIVEEYRLIGYENRLLETEDFEDDTKDAGEIGSNQTITALYEYKPVSQQPRNAPSVTIDFRYKLPAENVSQPLSLEVRDQGNSFDDATESMRFAASAAGFGMLLWESDYSGDLEYSDLKTWVRKARTYDPQGHRKEMEELIEVAEGL